MGDGIEKVQECGIDCYFSIINYPISLEDAMKKENAKNFVITNTEQICRLIKIVSCNSEKHNKKNNMLK